jgi:hypothetical protein
MSTLRDIIGSTGVSPVPGVASPGRHTRATTIVTRALLLVMIAGSLAAAPAPVRPATAAPPQAQAADNQDIRDIRPPYHIAPDWLWIAWAGGGIAAVALGYGIWRWARRARARIKLPYELALERLEAARSLMQPEQARDFSIAVSELVRDYIEISFPVRAAHRTTNEFLRDLATGSDSPLSAHRESLNDFLHYCDLAKFARWTLSVPQMEAMLQSAGAFILATGKPVAKPEKQAAPVLAGPPDSSTTTLHPQMS